MGKLTWQQLGRILEGEEFNITPEEASKIIFDVVLSKDWKGSANKIGKMWQDQEVVIAWTRVLHAFDELIKKHGKSKAMKNFYKKDREYFNWCLTSKTDYPSEKTFRNYFALFNKLPVFNAASARGFGTKTLDKVREKEVKQLFRNQKDNITLLKNKKKPH